jgi:solute carrier family 25 S-adenosylmethionine transporter 26
MPNTPYSIYDPVPLFQGSFQGITAQLAGTLPSGAVFFAVKDAVTAYLTSQRTSSSIQSNGGGFDWDVVVTTCIAVGLAQPPYWLLRNPSEVIKTRQQVGDSHDTIMNHAHVSSTTMDIPSLGLVNQNNNTITWDGVRDLYRGYWENIIYAYPADVIKFALYEILVSSSLQKQRRGNLLNGTNGGKKVKIGAMEGAMYGAVSTAIAQGVTTPLDVVRNRIMVNTTSEDATRTSLSYVDTLIELGREEGVNGLFAGVGPKVAKAFLSGAIQFALYEDTKQSMQSMFNNKR